MCVCVGMPLEQVNQKITFQLATYNMRCKAGCECHATPKAEISYMWHANPNATLQYPCVSDTPLTYFSWESMSGHLNRMIESRILWPGCKILYSTTYAIVHIESCSYVYIFPFVAFGNRKRSCPHRIMLVHLWVFHFLLHSDSHNAYMESRLKTTHHLFKWCRRLKAVSIAVYWLCVLGYLKFYLYSERLWVTQ